MPSTKHSFKRMTLQELEQYLSYLDGDWNCSFLVSFPTNGDKQIIEIDRISLKSQQFINSTASIKRKTKKSVKPSLTKRRRLKEESSLVESH